MLNNTHRYVAEASDREGRRLGELVLEPDFAPAAEWSHLQGMRCGALPDVAHHGPCLVDPVYDEKLGRPYIAGIRVRFKQASLAHDAPLIPWSYFQQWVEGSARRLVDNGTLRVGESFVYRICAFPAQANEAANVTTPGSATADEPVALRLDQVELEARRAISMRMSHAAWHATDFPVFVQPNVIEEATAMARAAGRQETGGILVGHLFRDTGSCEVHAEITAQIPATRAQAGPTHLEFTAETWSAVSNAIALRNRSEIWLGWHHYHPFFCRDCEPAQRDRCALSKPFFSGDDCELHRTVFDAAFGVALLLSDVGKASYSYDWFGWRQGRVAARGCYLLTRDGTPTPTYAVSDSTPAARVLNVNEQPR